MKPRSSQSFAFFAPLRFNSLVVFVVFVIYSCHSCDSWFYAFVASLRVVAFWLPTVLAAA
jgi:hypothetical protein